MSVLDFQTMTQRLMATRRKLDAISADVRVLKDRSQELEKEIITLVATETLHEKAAHLLTTIGEHRQEDAQRRIENLITLGLQTIFSEELTFHLVPSVRAKTPVVDFVVRSRLDDGSVVDTDVMDARGGGLAAVVGFLLRLVILLLSHQRQDTVMFLDETFAHVSAEYLPRLIAFIGELVERTGVQILMVTHEDMFTEAANVVYRFTLKDGITQVARL